MSLSDTSAALIGLAILFGAASCTHNPLWQDADGAREKLEDLDYNVVETGGYSWFGCGKGDLWRTKFVIKNDKGKEVPGVMCEGIFKGATPRFD